MDNDSQMIKLVPLSFLKVLNRQLKNQPTTLLLRN